MGPPRREDPRTQIAGRWPACLLACQWWLPIPAATPSRGAEQRLARREERRERGGPGRMGAAAAGPQGRRTLVLVNLASIMERADEALLPAVYREVGAALHATPTGLGALTLYRSIVQAACYPVAAYAASRHNRAHVIALGAFLWAAATFLVAVSDTFLQVAVSRGLNGIGLALVIPAVQSLVADSTDDDNRGAAFGWLQLTSSIGSIFGGFFALMLAQTTFLGIAGWRIAFHLVAIVSVIVGLLVWLFVVDPHFPANNIGSHAAPMSKKSALEEARELIIEAKSIIQIPTFQVFVAQGVSGSFPWSALSFMSMWLELIGFSHEDTAIFTTIFAVATSIGGLLGGKMGDFLAQRYPNAGRIILSQISAGSAVPLAAVLLLGLPDDPSRSSGVAHGLVLFIMGLIISWNGAATNCPIFAEIVPEKQRTSIYALDRTFESILASFAPPVVGLLSQHLYGFKPDDKGSSPEQDRENAASLAKALYTAISIPMVICTSIYTFMYRTYPRDRERARMQSMIQTELDQIELGGSHFGCGDDRFELFDTVNAGEKNDQVDGSYGTEESAEADAGTEKLLGNHE
ncbi:uncharacterized protein LOC120660515 isoform X1 [Panicum virgatum]|nr:uncharacterized protein LOC120660515 isoform X1 [Panicum virgatum]